MEGDFSIAGLFLGANLIVQIVLVLLFVMSVYSWGMVCKMHWELKRQRKGAAYCIKLLNSNVNDAEQLAKRLKAKTKRPSVVYSIISAGMRARISGSNAPNRSSVNDSMRVLAEREILFHEKKIAGLASVSSLSPFIGLFGTVIGIMYSFHAILASQNVTIKSIAPGMSEALFATAVGISVAIPAGLFYNRLSCEIEVIRGEIGVVIDSFLNKFGF